MEKIKVKRKKIEGGVSSDGARPKNKCSGGDLEDGGVEVLNDDSECVRRCMGKEKLDTLRRHLGDGRGECVNVVLLLVCYLLCRC